MARISLCMIVKNEEDMLAACLASVAHLVDEMIVADTGSTDRTVEIAEEAGATVIHHTWQNDFSAARNATLDAASGTYVLILDADERLAPSGLNAIRRVVRDNTLDCGLLPVHNATRLDASNAEILSGEARNGEPTLLPRLLRRTPDLRFRGVVHESVGLWLKSQGRSYAWIQCPIIHFGYVDSVFKERGKAERNMRLLEKRCLDDGDSPIARTYLAEALIADGLNDRAFVELQEAWESAKRVYRAGGVNLPPVVHLVRMLANFYIQKGRYPEVFPLTEQSVEWGFHHPNLDFLRGMALELRTLNEAVDIPTILTEASQCYEAALSKDGRPVIEKLMIGVTDWATDVRLGVVRLRLGDPEAAYASFLRVLKVHPELEQAKLGCSEVLILAGHYQEALADLEPLLQSPKPDAWVLAAWSLAQLGLYDDATTFCREAISRKDAGFIDAHRAIALVDLVNAINRIADERAIAAQG